MAARKKAASKKAPTTTYLVARKLGLRDVDGRPYDAEVGDEIDPAALGSGLRRLINSGFVVCLVNGVPIRKSRRQMSRLRGHKLVKVTGRHRVASEAKAAGGQSSSSTLPGGGEGKKAKAAGESAKKAKTSKKSKASKKKASKKKSSKKKKKASKKKATSKK